MTTTDSTISKPLNKVLASKVMPQIGDIVRSAALELEPDGDAFERDEVAQAVIREIISYLFFCNVDPDDTHIIHPCQLQPPYFNAFWGIED